MSKILDKRFRDNQINYLIATLSGKTFSKNSELVEWLRGNLVILCDNIANEAWETIKNKLNKTNQDLL